MSLINRVLPSIAHEFNRAFSLLEDPLFNTALRSSTRFPSTTEYFRPSVDVCETDKSYVIEAEVPGMKKDNLSVEFTDGNTLVLKGKIDRIRQGDVTDTSVNNTSTTTPVDGDTAAGVTRTTPSTKEKSPVYWSSERILGNFQRSFQFPGRVDPENVKANYKDGILSITVPKVEHHGTKINIE